MAGRYSCPAPTFMASEFHLSIAIYRMWFKWYLGSVSSNKPLDESKLTQIYDQNKKLTHIYDQNKKLTNLWSNKKGKYNHMLILWVSLYGYSFSFSPCHTSFSVHNIKLYPEEHIACTAWALMPMSGLAKIELLCGWRVQGSGLLIKIHVEM